MDRPDVSRRLKAARWLAGGVDEKGRPVPLSPEALAELEPLQRNGISANAIGEIERMIKDARPMELREIAAALDLSPEFFTVAREELPGLVSGRTVRQLEQALEDAERRRQEDLAAIAAELAAQVSLALETGALPSNESSVARGKRAGAS